MKQDRRFNGWVFVGSLIETIFSFAVVVAGVALAILAFTHIDMVNKLDDLRFFINQDYLNKLKPEFAYLFTGAGLAIIGLIFFIGGVANVVHVRRYKVSQHRVSILFECLLVLAMLAGVDTYLYFEMDNITRNIKYVIYGINVLYSIGALFNLLGVIFGRNEKFVSNDNNKFTFDNTTTKPLNVQVASSGEVKAPINPLLHQNIPNRVSGTNSNMPSNMQVPSAHQVQAQGQHMNGNLNTIYKTAPKKGVQTGEQLSTMRPINNIPSQNNKSSKKFCPKCGKMLSNEEVFCSLCGYKVGE